MNTQRALAVVVCLLASGKGATEDPVMEIGGLNMFSDPRARVVSYAICSEKELVAAGNDRGEVAIWELCKKKRLAFFSAHNESSITALAFGRKMVEPPLLLSGSDDMTIKVWDILRKKDIVTLSGHKSAITSLTVDPEGRQLVSTSGDWTARIWDMDKWRLSRTFAMPVPVTVTSRFFPDSKIVATGTAVADALAEQGHATLQLWETKTGQNIANLRGHAGSILSIAISPDEKRIFSGDQVPFVKMIPSRIKAWEWPSCKHERDFVGHSGPIRCLSVSPSGKVLASASDDKSVRLWDIASGKCIANLTSHNASVRFVCFSGDCKRLYSGGDDGRLIYWHSAQ